MAEPRKAPTTSVASTLTRKWGPMPVWAWVLIGGTGTAALLIFSRRSGGASSSDDNAGAKLADGLAGAGAGAGGGGGAMPGSTGEGWGDNFPVSTGATVVAQATTPAAQPGTVRPNTSTPGTSSTASAIGGVDRKPVGTIISSGTIRNAVESLTPSRYYTPSFVDELTTRNEGLRYSLVAPSASAANRYATVYTNAPAGTGTGAIISGVKDPRFVPGERYVQLPGGRLQVVL